MRPAQHNLRVFYYYFFKLSFMKKNKTLKWAALCAAFALSYGIFQIHSAIAASSNLILNPSMETASSNSPSLPLGWLKGGYGTNTRTLTYPVTGEDGISAVKTEITSYASGDAKWYFQPVSISGGQQMVFSEYYQSNVLSYVTIQYQLQDGSFKYSDIAVNLPASSSWTQFSKTFTVPSNFSSPVSNITIFHLIKSVGWIVTDNYNLQNNSGDTIPPTVSINPINSQPISGTTTLSATATDNVAVAGVQFILDGNNIGSESSTSPYSIVWDSRTVSDGTHSLVAKARDTAGNISTSSPVQLTVLNNTNSSTGTLVVIKHVVNSNSGTSTAAQFNLHIMNGTSTVDIFGSPFSGSELGKSFNLQPGTYSVSEDPSQGYLETGFSGNCNNQGVVNVIAGTTTTCTITNNDITPQQQGTITVNVVVVNNNTGTKKPGDFSIAVDTQGVMNGVATTFPTGSHIVSQTADPNYTTTITGDCDSQGNVILSNGEQKTCTITNDDIPPVPPVPKNFIANPSVETVSTSSSSLPLSWLKGGYGTNTRSLSYTTDSEDGAKGIKTEITSYTSGDAKWYFQPVSVSGGQQLTYSEYYKSNTPSYITIQYQLQDGSFKYQDLASNLTATSSWSLASFIFTVPTNYTSPVVNMTVFHLIKSVGWLSTDNYSLATYTPPPTDPSNAILNPGAEVPSGTSSSLPAFWSHSTSAGTTATYTYPVPGQNSSRGMQVDVTNYTGGAGARWYFQAVPVNGGDDYAFSDYFKSTTQSYLSIQFQMNDGTFQYLDLTRLATSTDWKQATDTFTVPLNASSLTILHILKGVGTLTTDNYVLKKLPPGIFSTGMVSLDFDDSLESVYQNAIPILNNAGIKSSQYVISQFIGDPDYWTTDQLSQIALSGHEIGAHTQTHPYLTTLNSIDLNNEIAGSKSDLASLGYNTTTFAYPFGDYNDVVIQAVKSAGFVGARSVRSGFNTKNSDPYALNDQHVEASTTINQIKSWIDQAKSSKTWLILELHDIDHSGVQYSTTPEILQQIVNYIKQVNISVVSNAQGLALMAS